MIEKAPEIYQELQQQLQLQQAGGRGGAEVCTWMHTGMYMGYAA